MAKANFEGIFIGEYQDVYAVLEYSNHCDYEQAIESGLRHGRLYEVKSVDMEAKQLQLIGCETTLSVWPFSFVNEEGELVTLADNHT